MASWNITPTSSPAVKLEASPSECHIADTAGNYSSLFATSAIAPSTEHSSPGMASPDMPLFLAGSDDISAMSPSPDFDQAVDGNAPDKKPTKKRKSWGQVLPEPKTNLPPRKRAKTEDEKEQRRVERVLRNRRAAQSSRERKRLEVEALEKRNQALEDALERANRMNAILYQKLSEMGGKPAVLPNGSAPVTLTQDLFDTQPFLETSTTATINPVSLSPTLLPVLDAAEPDLVVDDQASDASKPTQPQSTHQEAELNAAAEVASATLPTLEPSPDMTQRPAATLCPDLQCLSAEDPRVWSVLQTATPPASILLSQMTLLMTLSSAVISAFCHPMTLITFSLRMGTSIPPSPAILTSIIWLVTTPSASLRRRTSTSRTSSTTHTDCLPAANSTLATPASPRLDKPPTTLRLKMLRAILTCSPSLARPLKDATLRVLRFVSEKQIENVSIDGRPRPDAVLATRWSETNIASDGTWRNTATLPSKEVLLTLLWALRVEERRQEVKTCQSLPSGSHMVNLSGALKEKTTLPSMRQRKQRRHN